MIKYDPKCLELANYFADHRANCICARCEAIAEAVQKVLQAVEDTTPRGPDEEAIDG